MSQENKSLVEIAREEQEKERERAFFSSFDDKCFNEMSLVQQNYLYVNHKAIYDNLRENKEQTITYYQGAFMSPLERQIKENEAYEREKVKEALEQTKEELNQKQIELIVAEVSCEPLGAIDEAYEPLDIDKLIDESINNLMANFKF